MYTPFTIPKGLVKPGNNVLAVEVHQNNVVRSDLSFALTLNTNRLGAATTITSTVGQRTDIAESDIHYEAYFEPSGISPITGIVINEINTTTSDLLDNAGEAEDWIELYNAGTQAVNLAGLYVTDNLNNRTKHQLPAGSGNEMVLQPGAYKILWADEDLSQGVDHVNFKLSADGEAIGLYQVDGENIHTIDEYVLRVVSHTLKSNAASFGATELAELSRNIETDARAGLGRLNNDRRLRLLALHAASCAALEREIA